MKSRKWLWGVALALVAASPMGASTFMAMDDAALLEASTVVVEGEVLSVESFWDRAGRIIVTEATVLVRDAIFGGSDSVVRVKTFGGEVDGYRVEASGFPTFERGGRVFLYLKPNESEPGLLRVTGYLQGQYNIVRRAGVDYAVPAADDSVQLVSPTGAVSSSRVSMPLEELKERVREQFDLLQRDVDDGSN